MPFIRFSEESETADGVKKLVRFVNVDQITEATYDRSEGTFSAFIGDKPGGKGWSFGLKGDEAKDALAVFQKLHRDILDRAK